MPARNASYASVHTSTHRSKSPRRASGGVPSSRSSSMSSLCANSWNTTLCPRPGLRAASSRLIPREQHRTAAIVRFAEHRDDPVGHGAAHGTGVDPARLHRRRVHDDRADLSVFVDAQAEHEHRGLRRDGHGDLVVEREPVRRLPVLVPEQPVARRFEHLALAGIQHLPHRDALLDDVHPAVGQSSPSVQHGVSRGTRGCASPCGRGRPLRSSAW